MFDVDNPNVKILIFVFCIFKRIFVLISTASILIFIYTLSIFPLPYLLLKINEYILQNESVGSTLTPLSTDWWFYRIAPYIPAMFLFGGLFIGAFLGIKYYCAFYPSKTLPQKSEGKQPEPVETK